MHRSWIISFQMVVFTTLSSVGCLILWYSMVKRVIPTIMRPLRFYLLSTQLFMHFIVREGSIRMKVVSITAFHRTRQFITNLFLGGISKMRRAPFFSAVTPRGLSVTNRFLLELLESPGRSRRFVGVSVAWTVTTRRSMDKNWNFLPFVATFKWIHLKYTR